MKLPGHILTLSLMLVCAACLKSGTEKVPVDVITDGKDLLFILEKPAEIEFLRVREAGADPKSASKAFWLLGHDASTPVRSRKYAKLGQLRYGKKYEGFSWVEGPLPLKPNTEYLVEINMPGKFAREVFILTGKNSVIMPRPSFARQKSRGYEVSTDNTGEKVFTPK